MPIKIHERLASSLTSSDAAGGVHYLRKPRGLDSGTGLAAAVVGGEVRGNMFLTEDGKARRLR